MQPFTSSRSKLKLKILGWYQIVGGIVGLLITIWLLAHIGQINGLILLLLLIVFGLYSFSIYCGRLLFTNYDKGLNLSVINQILQIAHFSMLGYAYQYVSGLVFEIGMSKKPGFNLIFNFNFTNSTWQLSVGTSDRSFVLAINLVAIAWLYYIEKLRKTLNAERESFENLSTDKTPQADVNISAVE
ncbi:hypothetical protein [Mucilaginibacter sp. RCC_168]|uniref:hypothetical protein n=1 Tax=unclassified Mucilaginibacter TaxID=2617802 RepID=UPI003525B3F9